MVKHILRKAQLCMGLAPVALWLIALTVTPNVYAASPSPTITLSATNGAPNTRINVVGSGFPPNEIVGLYLDSPSLFLDAPGPRADAQGSFAKTITLPMTSGGIHNVCGDTAYPNSNQPIAAKACVRVFIELVATPSPSPLPTVQVASLPEVVGVVAVVALLLVGAVIWTRRSG